MNKPEQNEIDDVLNQCADSDNTGELKYPGMSYENGVAAAIKWLQGEGPNPMAD